MHNYFTYHNRRFDDLIFSFNEFFLNGTFFLSLALHASFRKGYIICLLSYKCNTIIEGPGGKSRRKSDENYFPHRRKVCYNMMSHH